MAGAVPTDTVEEALRAAYLRWIAREDFSPASAQAFADEAARIIQRLGPEAAMAGVRMGEALGMPAPYPIELDVSTAEFTTAVEKAVIKAGLAAGVAPSDVALGLLRADIDRAFYEVIRTARTEIVRAYWQEQWEMIDASGVGSMFELVWSCSPGGRTCRTCVSHDGEVVTDPTVRDHPNGRCTLVPRKLPGGWGPSLNVDYDMDPIMIGDG